MPPEVDLPADEPARVRAVWEGLGLPGLVDVHTHFMPDRVQQKVWAFFDALEEHVGTAWPIAYRLPDDERVRRLADLGVRAYTALNYPHKPGMAAWLNDWTADFAAGAPGCVPSATLYPEPDAPAYVAAALERGARVFKAHVQVGEYDPADPLLDPVWGLLAEAGVPTVIHAGSGPHPGRFTGPGPVAEVLGRHPRLPLVIAHLGMPEYDEFLTLAERHPGVHLDTTMAFTDFIADRHPFPDALLGRLADAGEKVVLGTDFPTIPHPYLHQLEAIVGLGLGDDWLRAVLHDNGARLLRVDAPG
ncbi:amidohydrolase family protein [Nocardioides sp. CFH 31398]|uniref:amidohydrolase family protein n=1 Tax=Nocardioides sp. CFH 31398 TaxID=2919579 RepID=UPI001F05E2F4|nr:amidohydrolase family protein [Nocardioides sp. CFH 31398]MCH1865901.1 amidohydrolase [Nocardioides sp. CFH 31398]